MKNRLIMLLAVGGCLLAAGCETTSDAELQAKFQAKCEKYGFKPGTDAFANCLMETEQNYYAALSGYMSRQAAAMKGAASKGVVQPTQTRCSTAYGHTNCTTY